MESLTPRLVEYQVKARDLHTACLLAKTALLLSTTVCFYHKCLS